jgi:integrase
MGREVVMGRLHQLNVSKVGALKEPGLYSDGGNLHLRVAPGGSKQWVFRYSLGRRTRDYGVGPFPTLSLAEARDRAHGLRKLLLDKIDPIEHRRQERATRAVGDAKHISFDDAATAYVASQERSWRSRHHAREWVRSLKAYASPVFGKLPISAVDTGLILRALKPIWLTKGTTATRVRGRIEAVLDWARVMNFRTGDNPARWEGHLEHLLPQQVQPVEHHAALPYAEIPDLMKELRGVGGYAAPALEFIILTAARVSEVTGATWGEISFADRCWTIPASRMKANREHRVPLCDAALDVQRTQADIRYSDLVFPGRFAQLSIAAIRNLIKARNITTHGFRSSFRDWCAEQTSCPREVCEMALAHNVGSAVERAYQRSKLFEKRAELMEAWGRHCTGIGGAAVVSLPASA